LNVTDDLTVELRAERDANEGERVYEITVSCSDASGNSASDMVTVTVPKGSSEDAATSPAPPTTKRRAVRKTMILLLSRSSATFPASCSLP